MDSRAIRLSEFSRRYPLSFAGLVSGIMFALLTLAVTPFLSLTHARYGSASNFCIQVNRWTLAEYGLSPEATSFSIGDVFNGVVIGRNKYGFYGRAAVNGRYTQWGTWLR